MPRPLQFFPIAIDTYHSGQLELLNGADGVEAEVRKVADLLADFGAQPVDWAADMAERGRESVEGRLQEWANPGGPEDTFLYWVGHGWSNGQRAALAHARNPRTLTTGGVSTDDLLGYIADREGSRAAGNSWAIVVIDACKSGDFVRILNHALDNFPHGPRRVLLVGVSQEASTRLGDFTRVLDTVLTNTFRADPAIELWDLGKELNRNLAGQGTVIPKVRADAALHRTGLTVTGTSIEDADELQAIISQLSPDQQRHFIPKAQGGELGEVSWFFEGRDQQRRQAAQWLRTHETGMLVVTGAPGAGKSAFLGDLVVQSNPDLRNALLDLDLVALLPDGSRPDDDVFDAVVHLTGTTPTGLVHELTDAFRTGNPPADKRLDEQTTWLTDRIADLGRRVTILVDALDEAQQPLTIARQVLRPLSRIPGVRVVVGTRTSTSEGPDQPATDTDLLDALGVPADETLPVPRDPDAITRYVRRRLEAACSSPREFRALRPRIEGFSRDIGDRNQEFLFARLAVRLVLDTGLLTGTADDLSGVLDGNHQGLFARAVTRLTQQNAVYEVLLEALALAQGRGLPIRDGIWATTAQALTNNDADTITDEHISALIDAAAPYLAVDTEHDQTVYRLAHKTFAEHLNPYLQNHLPAHTAHAGPAAWHTLADHTWVLDRLNPRAVVTHAFTQLFGRHRIPPEIAGVITAQHALSILAPSQRLVTRQIATTRCTATTHPSPHDINPAATWHLLWARMRRHPLHLTLTGHTDTVQAVAAFPGPDGRTLLATGSSDKTVRIWDPAAGTQVGDPLTSHTDPVRAVAVFPGPGGRTLLATGGGEETVRIWDPAAGTQVGDPLTGHTGGVRAASGSQLASSPACNASSACSSISGTGVATKPKNAHACAEKP